MYAPVRSASDLRDYMERYDFTSTELADALGIHRVTIAKYRRGELPIREMLMLALGSRTLIIRDAVRARGRARAATHA